MGDSKIELQSRKQEIVDATPKSFAAKESYHHGNLRQALIDAGIRIINESGEGALSLRKAAAACGVSHAAPYAHFKDKESLMEAIKETVTSDFAKRLEEAISPDDGKAGELPAREAIIRMGKSYILFFKENPDYFHFLFHKQKITVHTDMKTEHPQDYAPYLMLRSLYQRYIRENQIEMDELQQEKEILKTWAHVHGFASIACMEGVSSTMDWEMIVRECIS